MDSSPSHLDAVVHLLRRLSGTPRPAQRRQIRLGRQVLAETLSRRRDFVRLTAGEVCQSAAPRSANPREVASGMKFRWCVLSTDFADCTDFQASKICSTNDWNLRRRQRFYEASC